MQIRSLHPSLDNPRTEKSSKTENAMRQVTESADQKRTRGSGYTTALGNSRVTDLTQGVSYFWAKIHKNPFNFQLELN